ncbi:tRNA pseudouridine(55) synthase TruB [Emticicia sp. TH156]|uniref:tRNA pseudouridine(55) synthase TruB n=1 Tax=Emticicia sp. TH156 TaxID=2067454 RepID=UPI000C76BA01|nr:tRNA pseudouridine(55) synthase TruB [Emticicia sp. TH156]PLK43774.1 tRNA pseudouridine(55) synthase TruB [Emticicia sp. TH156]
MQTVPDERNDVLLIDKPLKWTSFDVVNKVRYAAKYKKVGHAGTLDPLATGLLILCTNKKTKEIETYQAQEKEYTGTLVLGKTTPSVDLETDFDAEYPISHITPDAIQLAVAQLTGLIDQIPPAHSAIKVDGKRAYESARKGQEVVIKSRQVEIKAFEVDAGNFPELSFRIVCSKGTYIRSLVRDLGKLLHSGAYMSSLRRTRIGEFRIENALSLDQYLENIRNFAPNN